MAVTVAGSPRYQWQCLSTDTKPTDSRVGVNDLLLVTDTGVQYIWNGSSWNVFPSGNSIAPIQHLLGERMFFTSMGDSLTAQSALQDKWNMAVYGANNANLLYATTKRGQSTQSYLAAGAMRSGGSWSCYEISAAWAINSGAWLTSSTNLLQTVLGMVNSPTLLARPPDGCVVQSSTHDIADGLTLNQTLTNLETIWASLQAVGIWPVATNYPAPNVSALTAAQLLLWEEYCYIIMKAAKEAGVPCADWYTPTVNSATGASQAVLQPDGIHFSPAGAAVAGFALNKAIQGAFGSQSYLIPQQYDASTATLQLRHPAFDALGAGSINTAGSYPVGWTAPNAGLNSTVFNGAGATETGVGFTMRPAVPAIAGIAGVTSYQGNSWQLTGDGTHGYSGTFGTGLAFNVGDRIGFYFRIKWIPNQSLSGSGFQMLVYDPNNGNTYGGISSNDVNFTGCNIGNETAYVAGEYYGEFTTQSWSQGIQWRLAFYNSGGSVTNSGDVIVVANPQIYNLTQGGNR